MIDHIPARHLDQEDNGTVKSLHTDSWIELNAKCILFGLLLCGIYRSPRTQRVGDLHNVSAQLMIMILAYIGMAGYDDYYDCSADGRLMSSKNTITGAFKPPTAGPRNPDTYTMEERIAEYKHNVSVYRAHSIFIGPMIMSVSALNLIIPEHKLASPLNSMLFGIGGLATAWHSWRWINPARIII